MNYIEILHDYDFDCYPWIMTVAVAFGGCFIQTYYLNKIHVISNFKIHAYVHVSIILIQWHILINMIGKEGL